MAFPVVAATNTNLDDDTNSTLSISLPASISAGDLLIVLAVGATTAFAPNFTTPSGWTQLFHTAFGSATAAAYYKVASGSEGSTLSIASDAALDDGGAGNAYRITGYQGTPEATATTGSSATPNPPNETASWGADDNLWIAATGCRNASTDLTAPTNYGNLLQALSALGTTRVEAASARRELNASAEDPGTFANASATDWAAATIVVRGAGAKSPPPFHRPPRFFRRAA